MAVDGAGAGGLSGAWRGLQRRRDRLFLGDSITHGGRFHRYISDYYLTRFPTRTVRFVNAGVSGDSAGGAMGRLDEDVLSQKPTSVAVMFGMNDVNRGSYVADPDAQKGAAQRAAARPVPRQYGQAA